MQFLAFQLYAPLASYGVPAVGQARPSNAYAGRSAILGLIAAALGIRRDDDGAQQALRDHCGVAVAVYSEGSLLRDYHTAQVPSAADLKHRPHATRADELAVPRHDLNTILSTRDYREDSYSRVLLWQSTTNAARPLAELQAALLHPRFTLYLGRKACPLAWPLQPQIVQADTLRDALATAHFDPPPGLGLPVAPTRVAWDGGPKNGGVRSGYGDTATFTAPRRDDPASRQQWLFAERTEYVALPAGHSP